MISERTETTFYCVRAKAANSVKNWVRKGDWLGFRWSDEGGGWPQLDPVRDVEVTAPKPYGKRWNAPPTQAQLSWWQQMPMGIIFDPATVEIIRFTEVHEVRFEMCGILAQTREAISASRREVI